MSILKVFALVRDYKVRFLVSQLAMLVAAVCIVAYASLISDLVDKGMVAGDQEAAVDIGIWMLALAVVMGASIAVAGSQAVFFSQGAALYIRRELFDKVQHYSFENFDHRPTSELMSVSTRTSSTSRMPCCTRSCSARLPRSCCF
jgi:ATP-binding cassette subfamily B multidrug efflux pump